MPRATRAIRRSPSETALRLYAENVIIALLGGAMLVAVAYRFGAHYSALTTAGFAALALIGRVALRVRGTPSEEA